MSVMDIGSELVPQIPDLEDKFGGSSIVLTQQCVLQNSNATVSAVKGETASADTSSN